MGRLMNVEQCHKYILDNYMTKTYEQLSRKTRMSPYKIKKYLNSQGLTKEKIFDRDFFHSIDTPEKAYYLGLIYADGSIHNSGFTISLKYDDKYILERLAELLGGAHEVKQKESRNTLHGKLYVTQLAILSVSAKEMREDLISLGVVPRKTYEREYPRCNKYFFDFLRGYLDGDGCIYTNDKEISIILTGSNYNFFRYLNSMIKKTFKTHGVLSSPDRWEKRLRFTRRDEVISILKTLYQDKNSPRLERKYMKYYNYMIAHGFEVIE